MLANHFHYSPIFPGLERNFLCRVATVASTVAEVLIVVILPAILIIGVEQLVQGDTKNRELLKTQHKLKKS